MMGVEIFDAAEGGSLQTSPVLEWMHASWAFQGPENLNLGRVDEVLEPGNLFFCASLFSFSAGSGGG